MGHHPSDCLFDRFGIYLASEEDVGSQQMDANDRLIFGHDKGEPMWFTATGFEIPTEAKKLDQTNTRLWK